MPRVRHEFDEELFEYDYETNRYWCVKCHQQVGKNSRYQHEMTKKHWEGLIEYYQSLMLPETI
jgi:hypothetical protein